MWRASRKKFPAGPSEGLKRWSLGPLNNNPLEYSPSRPRVCDIAGMRVLNFKTIFINHPDLIEEVLVTTHASIRKAGCCGRTGTFWRSLLTSEENSGCGSGGWRNRVSRARIASYAATMVEYTQRMLNGWRGGEEHDAHQEMMRLTLQIVGKTLFDADVEGDAQEVGKSLELLLEIGANFRRTIFVPHWLPLHESTAKREIAQIEKFFTASSVSAALPPRHRRSTVDASFGARR